MMKMAVTQFVVCLQLLWCFALVPNVAPQPTTLPTTTASTASNGNPLRMSAGPDPIFPELTESFSVSCSLDNDTSLGYPMDIILYQYGISGSSQTRQKIASVSAFEPLEVNFHPPRTATTGTCHFEDGTFDLTLYWENPQTEQAGDYECEATFMNSDVDYSTFVKHTHISYRIPSLSDVVDHIKLDVAILKNQVAASTEIMLSSSEVLNGHRYHLSTFPYVNFERAEEVCKMVRGHVAVLENDVELKDAVDFVKSLGYSSPQFLVGIYDETNTGNWVNKATGHLVSFVKWYNVNHSASKKCAYLYSYSSASSWRYDFAQCSDPTSTKLFLCKSN